MVLYTVEFDWWRWCGYEPNSDSNPESSISLQHGLSSAVLPALMKYWSMEVYERGSSEISFRSTSYQVLCPYSHCCFVFPPFLHLMRRVREISLRPLCGPWSMALEPWPTMYMFCMSSSSLYIVRAFFAKNKIQRLLSRNQPTKRSGRGQNLSNSSHSLRWRISSFRNVFKRYDGVLWKQGSIGSAPCFPAVFVD